MWTLEPVGTVPTFVVGVAPAALVCTVLDDQDIPVPMDGVSGTGALVAPDQSRTAVSVTTDLATDTLSWTWPGPLPAVGLYAVEIALTDADGPTDAVDPFRFVVQAEAVTDGWLSLAQARHLWPDAPADDWTLYMLLESARSACVAYLGALYTPGETLVELPWLQAQMYQARSVWNMAQTSPQAPDALGMDAYAIRVYPLDYNIRQLLRPKSGKPVMW